MVKSATMQFVTSRLLFTAFAFLLLFPSLQIALCTTLVAYDATQDAISLLQDRCFSCHGHEKQEGGLRLDSYSAIQRRGDSMETLLPNNDAQGEIIRRISSADKHDQMPPIGDRLTQTQIDSLRRWFQSPDFIDWSQKNEESNADPKLDHWAWKAIVKPEIPVTNQSSWCRNEIDTFILRNLEAKGLLPSVQADPRTLIRRLSFDLIGLPPTPQEVSDFQQDFLQNPQSYEALVDRYLSSPRYGERWARHWLDIVHYGDTHGYDKDKPRLNAWPYRDYVIRSLNADIPYTQFIEEQIAGDVLASNRSDGLEALGFISAGPWDFIGHAEVSESKIDGKVARHLDRDDMVGNAMGTFCSLTVQCAQCHNHKFDPITQEDYYSLQAVFAALDRADREYFEDAVMTNRYSHLKRERIVIANGLKEIENVFRKNAGKKLQSLDEQIEVQKKSVKGNTRPDFGFHSAIATSDKEFKWVQIDFGNMVAIQQIVLNPCYDDFNRIGAGFGFPVRYVIEISDDSEFKSNVTRLVDRDDRDYQSPKLRPQVFDVSGNARYMRITATKLAHRSNDYIFALAEAQVFDDHQVNITRDAKLTALDSIESSPRWRLSNLTDGYWPTENERQSLEVLENQRSQLRREYLDAEMQRRESELNNRISEIDSELKLFPPAKLVYSATIYTGTGSFTGTGTQGGQPRTIRILQRGSVEHPGREVNAGTVSAFKWSASRFELPVQHVESDRRVALARWIAHTRNPLTWRSIVNRIWQYHFGRGLVETSNDFGRMGSKPSHPDLLDWLASEMLENGHSIKQIHKKIVMSSTYMQASSESKSISQKSNVSDSDSRAQSDEDNHLYWRQNRRKLEAEPIRDAILSVADSLSSDMGGPGYQDFVIEHPEHSPHYEYEKADPNDTKTWRRSVYRFVVRSQTQPWMTTLDCPDPSIRIDRRNESQSPLQALSLLNNGMILVQAKRFALRIRQLAPDDPMEQLNIAVQRALQRELRPDERQVFFEYLKVHGLENLCRILFNLNEFVFID